MKDVTRFPLRVGLIDLVPVPERKNVCFVQLRFKSPPAEFILFLGTYLEDLEARQEAWESLGSQDFLFDQSAARQMGAGSEFLLISESQKWPVELVAFRTKSVVLQGASGVDPGPFRLQMSFRDRPLVLEGTWDGKGSFTVAFHADWLDLVEDFQFHRRLGNKNEVSKGAGG
jgi:hypothetical protein